MRANEQEITLTFDMAWDLCLKRWDWVKAQIEAGPKLSVIALKRQWCKENGFGGVPVYCFFCEYDSLGRDCVNCPGRLVDPEFACCHSEYHYEYKPLAFHAELVRLNKIRLGLKE